MIRPEDEYYKTEPIPLDITYKGQKYTGFAKPVRSSCHDDACFELEVTLNDKDLGTITCAKNLQWQMKGMIDQELTNKIGEEILLWYE